MHDLAATWATRRVGFCRLQDAWSTDSGEHIAAAMAEGNSDTDWWPFFISKLVIVSSTLRTLVIVLSRIHNHQSTTTVTCWEHTSPTGERLLSIYLLALDYTKKGIREPDLVDQS